MLLRASQPQSRDTLNERVCVLISAWCNAGVSIAVGHVNEGNLSEAIDILDHIIATTNGAHLSGAHVARGTARAMMRDLKGLQLYKSPATHAKHTCWS
jgi:hypothetical protein